MGILLEYGAALIGQIYYGVPEGGRWLAGMSWVDTKAPGKMVGQGAGHTWQADGEGF